MELTEKQIDAAAQLLGQGKFRRFMSTLTVTAKGQITLKRDLLRHLNVEPGQKVEVDMLPDGRIAIGPVRPQGSIDAFIGSLAKKDGPKLTIKQIKDITERAWAGER